MHLVCPGVVRQIIKFWKVEESSKIRLSASYRAAISLRFKQIRGQFPYDFVRQPRSLDASAKWKVTELRQFLLYSRVLILKGVRPRNHYIHFPNRGQLAACLLTCLLPFHNEYTESADDKSPSRENCRHLSPMRQC